MLACTIEVRVLHATCYLCSPMHGLPERLVLPPLKGQCGTETAHYVVVSGHVLSGAWRPLVNLLIMSVTKNLHPRKGEMACSVSDGDNMLHTSSV